MTIVHMTRRPKEEKGWEYSETIATGATGDDIVIPTLRPGTVIAITLYAGSNTGKFQATSAPDSQVLAGTVPANRWFDLPLTSTTGTVPDAIIASISGLRGVSLAGEISIEVKI